MAKKPIYSYFIFFFLFFLNTSIAASLEFNIAPWQLNPDGKWESIISINNPTGSQNVVITSSAGTVIRLAPWVFNASAIKVILDKPQSIHVIASITKPLPSTGESVLLSPSETHQGLQISGKPIGPYLINLGISWIGNRSLQYLILQRKAENDDTFKTLTTLDPTAITFQDTKVKPNQNYQYKLIGTASDGQQYIAEQTIKTPAPMKNYPVSTFTGKGIILLFDMDVGSKIYYKKLNIKHMISDAVKLGFRYIQIRSVYGSFSHFNNPDLIKWLDDLLDEANANNIDVISWSLPQIETSNAIASDIAVASHTTRKGNTFAGISMDLEIGSDYIFQTKTAKDQIVEYMKLMNLAVGKDYLLSAILYTPYKSGYDNSNYPYAELEKYVDIMQPMVFWHHYNATAKHIYTQTEVRNTITQAIQLTQKLSNATIPISVIAQFSDLGSGIPSPTEIQWAIQAAKDSNAIGISFFDWNEDLILDDDTVRQQTKTIQDFPW